MPYFIYRIETDKTLEQLETFPKYRDAIEKARELRAAQTAGETATVKIIFAQNPTEAERLLLTPREAPVEGDD
ncbi:hypothetical protein [Solemya velesiana gill symbiont]|uniref:DUF1330 domain-containing protein n=1 Tax=Solemya velesiana gill symbiont TaxID=1918948 RepID=A0A1T2KTN5_9GAMM|nr:hypothetical protein [Solemya velesiana gill symbiont]OOZ36228.1 hypothetical protein BOW51_08205 [Solemya velesiana gill symbiont]